MQRGLNEAEIKAVRKAWSTRSSSGILFVPAMALRSLCCCRDVQRGELTLAKAMPVPSAFMPLPEQTVELLVLLGKHTELGTWHGRSILSSSCTEISFSQWGRRISVSLGHSHGPSSVASLTEDLGKAGAILIMATDVGTVFSKLGLANHGSCQAV